MMHTINPLIGRFLCVFQELLWTCKVIEFGRSACHVTYQGPSCNPTLKFTPNIMIFSQCGRKAMGRCCHSTESKHKLASSNQSFRRKGVFCQGSIDAGSDLFWLVARNRFISVWVTELHLLPWQVQKLWQCTGLSTEFPNDEWTNLKVFHFFS